VAAVLGVDLADVAFFRLAGLGSGIGEDA
jgi:hypothetical protein